MLPEIQQPWSAAYKLIFRFFFLAVNIIITPFVFLQGIPGMDVLMNYVFMPLDKLALWINQWLYHITPATQPPNGNGDTPEQWMGLYTGLLLAVVGTIIWSLLDRKRPHYSKLNYWLCLGLRYFIISNGLSYGIFKLFAVQMPFPSLSQLATPLGDYLPMRFSWMFIGYSFSYQFFSGLIEVVAALLLLFRPTATLGILVSLGVFFNVMMLNLSYDIPVKINSITLVVICCWLLAMELPRLIAFFFHNRAESSNILQFPFSTKRGRRLARTVKWVFVGLTMGVTVMLSLQSYNQQHNKINPPVLKTGMYDVLLQVHQGDTLSIADTDSLFWQNFVLDKGMEGSIKTTDSRFRQRYGRGYFNYKVNSVRSTLSLFRRTSDSVPIVQFRYEVKDSVTLMLRSIPLTDSLQLTLRRRTTVFPLGEKQFHWISETNR